MKKNLYSATTLFFILLSVIAEAQPPVISFETPAFISGLSVPIDLVNAGDGSNRLFIVQQDGLIKVRSGISPFTISNFMNLGATGLNLIIYGGERGLLSMAFHPDYDGVTNRYFFVYYTEITTGNIVVRRFQTVSGNTNAVVPGTGLEIINIPHSTNNNHNGGKLNFGPDGYLYFATGDGGGGNDVPNNAQNGNVLLGKMIRIDINNPVPQTFGNYVIPSDNPYILDGAILDEIWALGLRNPFRWSFDRANGNMWIGDVGQAAKEEVNYRPAGSTGHINYGWRCYEGSISTPSVPDCTPTDNVFPIFDYDNPNGGAAPSSAVTGGFVYRGSEYPGFIGYYIAADVYSGTIYLIRPNGTGWTVTSQTGLQNFIVAFGEAENGDLYAVSQGSNSIYKVVATGGTPLPVTLTSFGVKHFALYNELKWTTSFEQGTSTFHIEVGKEGGTFTRAGKIIAARNATGSNYVFQHQVVTTSSLYYRLAIEDDDGKIKYSSVIKVSGNDDGNIKIYPTLIKNSVLTISLSAPANKLQLINSNGEIVFEKNLQNFSGTTAINLPYVPKGMYIVQVVAEKEIKKGKVIIE